MIKLYAFTCGTVTGEFAHLMDGRPRRLSLPQSRRAAAPVSAARENTAAQALFRFICGVLLDKPFPSDPQPAARDEPAGYRSALGGPIGTIWIGYLLPDQHPVTPPARVFVVAVLQLVTWGCRDTSRSTGIHALGDAGPTAPAGELRSLRHCGREAYGGQQGETRAGEQ